MSKYKSAEIDNFIQLQPSCPSDKCKLSWFPTISVVLLISWPKFVLIFNNRMLKVSESKNDINIFICQV